MIPFQRSVPTDCRSASSLSSHKENIHLHIHKAIGCPEKRAGYCCKGENSPQCSEHCSTITHSECNELKRVYLQGDLERVPKVISTLQIEMHRQCKWERGMTVLEALSASYNLELHQQGYLQTNGSSDAPSPAPPLHNRPCLELYMH